MIKNCPICGKAFDVLWPELWRYVRKNRYLCSWKCIRLYDKEKKEEEQMKKDNEPIKRLRMSKDDMAEAVRLWRENDPGLEQYLKDHGITHIGKWKQNAKIRYREKPADYGQPIPGFGPWDEEPAATVKVDGPLNIETDKPEKININPTHEGARVIGRIIREGEKPLGFAPPIPSKVQETIKKAWQDDLLKNRIPDHHLELTDKYQTVAIRHPNLGVFYYDQKFHCIDWRSDEGDEISLSLQAWSELHKDLPEIFKRLGVEL